MIVYMYTILYSQKIWWGFKFGGLAVYLCNCQIKSANISYLHILPNRQILIRQYFCGTQPPNLIPVNISGYTVIIWRHWKITLSLLF